MRKHTGFVSMPNLTQRMHQRFIVLRANFVSLKKNKMKSAYITAAQTATLENYHYYYGIELNESEEERNETTRNDTSS